MGEMADVAGEAKELEGLTLKRCEQALSHLSVPDRGFDPAAAEARLAVLIGQIMGRGA